jgi:hypothetical protein
MSDAQDDFEALWTLLCRGTPLTIDEATRILRRYMLQGQLATLDQVVACFDGTKTLEEAMARVRAAADALRAAP